MNCREAIPYSALHTDARVLDVFLPEPAEARGAAILWIHGGGWSAGARKHWHALCRHFAERGLVCASIDYRLVPAWTWPAQVEDVRLAMAFLRAHASEWGFAPDRIAAAGSSAGGHLAALLAMIEPADPLGATPELTHPDTLPNAAICYCPVTMMIDPEDPTGKLRPARYAFMGCGPDEDPERYRLASPADRITGREPPFLFLHGDKDTLAPPAHSLEMDRRLRAAGVRSEAMLIPGALHGFGYGTASQEQKAAIGHIERFLAGWLGKPS
jgi:acetyl esterase/lipase